MDPRTIVFDIFLLKWYIPIEPINDMQISISGLDDVDRLQ